ncbi:MAG: DTW domain-containing protein [Chlamydiales bacterium]|nr:DTW domain-containing protein [Chlamydiales bacterium]
MTILLPTIILRHRKENLKKCSLRGLEKREDFLFYTYPKDPLPSLDGYILLSMDGDPLSEKDHEHGLFLIDGTWNYADVMYKSLPNKEKLIKRSLPKNIYTAYPRKQTGCLDPERGLASIEALYAAYLLMGRDVDGLLDNYHWKDLFLKQASIQWLLE